MSKKCKPICTDLKYNVNISPSMLIPDLLDALHVHCATCGTHYSIGQSLIQIINHVRKMDSKNPLVADAQAVADILARVEEKKDE